MCGVRSHGRRGVKRARCVSLVWLCGILRVCVLGVHGCMFLLFLVFRTASAASLSRFTVCSCSRESCVLGASSRRGTVTSGATSRKCWVYRKPC